MKVLMITGDKRMIPGHPRFDLQASSVEKLVPLYWGLDHWWPDLPLERFDVITAQDPFWRGLIAWGIARYTGAKLNIQVHADLSSMGLFKQVLARVVLGQANSVRVVSEKIKEQVERFGVKVPISVLPVYIDIEKFKAASHKLHEQQTILWVGRFEDEKDPLYALEVLREVRAAQIDARMIMLGAGTLEQVLRLKAAALPVQFPGWHDPLPYLEQTDVVLCTSRQESYGASIIEALAARVPVVAPDLGVAKEAGAIIENRDELAQATIRVLQTGLKGELKLSLLNKEEWTRRWQESLKP